MVPGKMMKGIGGAKDSVAAAQRAVVLMEHTTKAGECLWHGSGAGMGYALVRGVQLLVD